MLIRVAEVKVSLKELNTIDAKGKVVDRLRLKHRMIEVNNRLERRGVEFVYEASDSVRDKHIRGARYVQNPVWLGDVLGLARNENNADIIRSLGAESYQGDLEDIESLRSDAKAADAVIHLVFIHDFTKFDHSLAVDRASIQAMGEELVGKPFIIVGGTMGFPQGSPSTEDTEPSTDGQLGARNLSLALILKLSKKTGVLGAVVRLAPTVHGKDDQGFMTMMGGLSREAGGSYYVDDGINEWPAVHRLDAAVLLRLAVERAAPGGVTYIGASENVPSKDFMTTVGKKLNIPVAGKPQAEVDQALGFFGHLLSLHNPVSNEKTRKELGWAPTRIGLIADLQQNYFL